MDYPTLHIQSNNMYKELIFLLLSYSLLTVMGSFFIMGFYLITRHNVEQLPDESYKVTGKIFKEWSIFFEKVQSYNPVYYEGGLLLEKLLNLKKFAPNIALKLKVSEAEKCLEFITNTTELTDEEWLKAEQVLQCDIFKKDELLFLYRTIPVYKFPEIIRMPLSSCAPCMASILGTIFWWGIYAILNNYANFDLSVGLWFCLWIPYCLSVSLLNKIIDSKINLN